MAHLQGLKSVSWGFGVLFGPLIQVDYFLKENDALKSEPIHLELTKIPDRQIRKACIISFNHLTEHNG